MTATALPTRPRLELDRPPAYATRPSLELASHGSRIAATARLLGRPLLPWQRYVADVATEVAPPGSEYYWRYQTVIVAVPRQAGKTTLMRPVLIERAHSRPNSLIRTTAQLGKDASERWADLVADIEQSPLASAVSIKRGKGSEVATFPNGSRIAPFAPGEKALHGESPQTVLIDEGWAFSEDEGNLLMAAIRPAQIAQKDRQLWIISAAGTDQSVFWNQLVDAGRAATEDPDAATAFFEWTADEDADPYDPDTWQFHPALGHLISERDLAQEARPENNTHANFLRMFLNRRTKAESTLIDLAAFDDLTVPDRPEPDPARLAIAYDVAIDRTAASVWTAWRDAAGFMNLHVLETRPGVEWLADYIEELHRTRRAGVIGADNGGPARLVTDTLRRRNVPVETINGADAGTAWTAFKHYVESSTLVHEGSPALRAALEVAAERRGDSPSLDRSRSLGPIDAAVAAVSAAWLADRIAPSVQLF